MKLLKKILKLVFILFLLALFFLFGYYVSATKDIVLHHEKLLLNENEIVLFDENNKKLLDFAYSEQGKVTKINDLPSHTIFAFVDTEDKRFFSHNGFDLPRILKAAWTNVKSGSFKEGASTISQQLIKNTHLSHEKTIKRKLREMKLTKDLERDFEKNDILEKYLNSIYFGHNCFGINSAANYYFGKEANDLTVAQSALLAGLIRSPNNYSPFKNAEKCKKRRELVLNLMYNQGHLSKEEKEQALEEELPKKPTCGDHTQSYLHACFDELERLSEEKEFRLSGKIHVYTHLNSKLQAFLKEITSSLQSDYTLCIAENHSYGIKAYLSSVNEIRRAPASIIKPLLIYAPALEKGYLSPATPILDEPIDFEGYAPVNHDGKFHGYVSTREAISKSLNIPAVKTLNAIGIEKAIEYLKRMNFTLDENDTSLSLALGGMTNGLTVKELLSGYLTLANGGKFSNPSFIRKIEIENYTVFSQENSLKQIYSEDTSYLMADMLSTCAQTGTAKKLRTLPFPIAAKTGTNGVKSKNFDAYAFSYTPVHTVGVWLGNANYTPIDYVGGGAPCNLTAQIYHYLNSLTNNTQKTFPKPSSVAKIDLDKIDYLNNHTITMADKNTPIDYKFQEIFSQRYLPSKQSKRFSNPSIKSPEISVNDDKISFRFDEEPPSYYRYVVKKYYYATHNNYVRHSTIYDGSNPNQMTDTISDSAAYVYSITPYYKDIKGKEVFLPCVSIKNGQHLSPTPQPDITIKNWWNY